MKKIVILLEEKTQDYAAGIFIKDNIVEVLEDTVSIDVLFLSDMEEVDFTGTDLFLVMVPRLLHRIYDYIQSRQCREKVLLVSRTLGENSLAKINAIPAGERVLVVNRLQETTADLIKLLYELEVIHLDFVPYSPEIDPNDFKYVITTGIVDLFAGCNTKVVNIGFRQLGTQAVLDIFSRLNIRDSRLTQNLNRYIQTLPPKYNDVEKRYLQSQVTDKILEKVIENSDFGVLVADNERRVLYVNQKAIAIFQTDIRENEPLSLNSNQALAEQMFQEDFCHELVKIGEEYTMIERHPLKSGNDPIGFYFECHTAEGIRSLDSKLSEKLHKSGFYAKYKFKDIIYLSPEMRNCLDIAKQLAKTQYAILISGESGSGKEMFAQSIHNASDRFSGPFIAVNCAAFPESLLESELFGYEGGSFTGSKREGKAGLFELANRGSIFLDEIGDMPLTFQAKLLRVLQEKKIMRVGSNHMIDIDVRVLSASNKDLREEIAKKNFRADLYYRLSTFTITIPPLRTRKADILPLFYSFSRHKGQTLPTEEEQKLLAYQWPGNVRELQNVAAYFDVIGTIDSISTVPTQKIFSVLPPAQEIKHRILYILARYPDVGLGRGRMLELLKHEGMILSESRFEQLIRELVLEKKVLRGKGRQGIRLTETMKNSIKVQK